MIPDKERTELVDEIVKVMEQDQRDCTDPEEPLFINVFGRKNSVKFVIKHSQFDRSLIEKISGLGGAICTMVNTVMEFLDCLLRDNIHYLNYYSNTVPAPLYLMACLFSSQFWFTHF